MEINLELKSKLIRKPITCPTDNFHFSRYLTCLVPSISHTASVPQPIQWDEEQQSHTARVVRYRGSFVPEVKRGCTRNSEGPIEISWILYSTRYVPGSTWDSGIVGLRQVGNMLLTTMNSSKTGRMEENGIGILH